MKFVEALETEATEQLESIRQYRLHAGSDRERSTRAKLALGVVGAYVGLRRTIANERTNALVEKKLLLDVVGGTLPALSDGK
jgi:pantothenate kinase type III